MKKTYLQPLAMVEEMETWSIICDSQGGVQSDNGIGYGGVDVNGELDPASRQCRDIWDDEEGENW